MPGEGTIVMELDVTIVHPETAHFVGGLTCQVEVDHVLSRYEAELLALGIWEVDHPVELHAYTVFMVKAKVLT